MINLYKVYLRHCGPKSCIEVIQSYVLASSEYEVMENIDKHYNSGLWKEKEHYDKEDKKEQTCYEKVLKYRGDYNYPNADYSDSYYGIKHFGWSEVIKISESDAEVGLRLGIIEDWRNIKK